MTIYFSIGLGVYLGLAALRWRGFKGATVWEILKGIIFGIPLWPLALAYLAIVRE